MIERAAVVFALGDLTTGGIVEGSVSGVPFTGRISQVSSHSWETFPSPHAGWGGYMTKRCMSFPVLPFKGNGTWQHAQKGDV